MSNSKIERAILRKFCVLTSIHHTGEVVFMGRGASMSYDKYEAMEKEIDKLKAELANTVEHTAYILSLWKSFVDTEYGEGKTLDAYGETIAWLSSIEIKEQRK